MTIDNQFSSLPVHDPNTFFNFHFSSEFFCFENLTLGLQSLSESNDFRANNPISKDFHSTMVSSSWENSTNFYIFKSFLPGLHIWKKYVLGQLYRKVNTFCEDHCGCFVVHSSSRPSKMPENSDEHGYNPLSDLRSWWILIFNIWWCFGGYVNVPATFWDFEHFCQYTWF